MQDFQSTKIACTYDIYLSPQFVESLLIKWLCEYIGELIFGVDIREWNISIGHMIMDNDTLFQYALSCHGARDYEQFL